MAKESKKTELENQEKTALSAEEMQALFAELQAEARREAAAIIDEAKAAAAEIVDAAKRTAAPAAAAKEDTETKAWLNEKVKIKLFKDNGKYKDDAFVSCNGESYAIKRGAEVEVPRKIALILDQSYSQDIETTEMMERKSAEFERSGL